MPPTPNPPLLLSSEYFEFTLQWTEYSQLHNDSPVIFVLEVKRHENISDPASFLPVIKKYHTVSICLLQYVWFWGEELLNKVLYGEVPSQGPSPYPFIYHFFTEKVPHSYLPLKNGTPLTYLLNTNKPLKHEVFLSFNFRVTFEVWKWYGHKARLFETIQLKNLFLYLKSIEVPTLSYENSLPFDILETWKNVPLSGVAKANTDRKCPSTRECRAVAFEKKLLSIFGKS